MESKTWVNTALGEDGGLYHLSICLLPVIPVILTLFVWYAFWGGSTTLASPLWVKVFVWAVVTIFLYQEIGVVRFLLVASRTAKEIGVFGDRIVTLRLFSGRQVEMQSFDVSDNVDRYEKSAIHKRLFPESGYSLSVNSKGEEYFISSTTEDFAALKKVLCRLAGDY